MNRNEARLLLFEYVKMSYCGRITFLYKYINVTNLSPVVTAQCPETMSNLSNYRCPPRSRVGEVRKCKISKINRMTNKTIIFVLQIWNITSISAAVTVQCPQTISNISNFIVSNCTHGNPFAHIRKIQRPPFDIHVEMSILTDLPDVNVLESISTRI